ncbi:MAG: gamma-glutamyltransferase [Gammaproteobacteria bacterium]
MRSIKSIFRLRPSRRRFSLTPPLLARRALALLLLAWPLAGATDDAGIASAHPLATAAGRELLAAGGNAFDAAIAVTATLAVVEPYSSGLGGGGFFLLHRARDGFETMIDARERAPLAAHADMYLDSNGEPLSQASLRGPLAAGIPGVPAALVHLAGRYGRLPLSRSLAPAIRHARDGFAVTPRYRQMAERAHEALLASPASAAAFLANGFVPDVGDTIRQPQLAATFEALARRGVDGFYRGPIAKRMVQAVRAGGGIWTLADLAQYRIVERTPLRTRYRGATITTAAPPSGGGLALIQMLALLETFDIDRRPPVARTHLIVEAMRRAYRDRALYLGDPDFPEAAGFRRLLEPSYLERLRASIDPARATPSARLGGDPLPGGAHTTHFSIIDTAGNRVAATLSINTPFGSGFTPPGTGVLLNNEMDDFAQRPGTPNTYGLVGSSANAIAPGKRPLSSMTPTFIETGDGIAVLGTPGGSRIPTMVLLAALEVVAGRGTPSDWVALPRFHHQYLPDLIEYEPGAFDTATAEALAAYGHTPRATREPYGNMHIVARTKRGGTLAAADPRGEGNVWVGNAGLRKKNPSVPPP